MQLPGFRLVSEVGRGANSVVYRADRHGKTYAVKLPTTTPGDADAEAFRRFFREAAVQAGLRSKGLPAIHAVGEIDGRPYLVRDFIDGVPLARVLEAERRVSVPRVLAWARTLTEAIAVVHARGLVHRDIKPQNILVDQHDQVTLIDFGFVMRAGQQRDGVAGTFRYSPPEQTGMIKRPVDGRSDLYSLGVVLYECLAGRPPFTADSVGELIRQHAVTSPPELRTLVPEVPPALAAIVHRLLAKDPDDRYRTATALLADLTRLEAGDSDDDDGRPRRRRPSLWGAPELGGDGAIRRPLELQALRTHWQADRPGLAIVEAGFGMGKTTLGRAFLGEVVGAGDLGCLIACTEGDPRPFAALRQVLDSLARQVAGAADDDPLRARLVAAGRTSAAALASISLELGRLVGAEEAEDLPAVHEEFATALTDFFVDLGAGGLSLVFDDAQWLDTATCRVLENVLRAARGRLLVVLLVRTDELASNASLLAQLEAATPEPALRFAVPPMGRAEVAQLVRSLLGDLEVPAELPADLAARSGGNPAAVVEYVRAMIDRGLLRPSWGRWEFDLGQLDQLELPADVLQLVERRASVLSASTQAVLAVAAAIGHEFDLELLTRCQDEDLEAIAAAMEEAVAAGLLVPQGSGYAFVHGRARLAILAGASAGELRRLHQRVAEELDRFDDGRPGRVFRLAFHYTRGEVATDPPRAYRRALEAGRRALANHASEESLEFLEEARRICADYSLTPEVELLESLGEACAHIGRTADAARHYTDALEREEVPLRRARLLLRRANVHLGNMETGRARADLELGLELAGSPVQRSPVLRVIVTLWLWLLGLFFARPSGSSGSERHRIVSELYEMLGLLAYFDSHTGLMLHMALRPMYAANRLGPSRSQVKCYGHYACLLAMAGLQRRADRYARRAIEVAHQLADPVMIGHAEMFEGVAAHIGGQSLRAERLVQQTLEQHGRKLTASDFINGCGDLAWNYLLRGYFAEAMHWSERSIERSRGATGGFESRPSNLAYLASTKAILGHYAEAQDYLAQYRHDVEDSDRFRACELYSHTLLFHLATGELGDKAEATVAAHRRLGIHPRLATFHLLSFYVFEGYTRAWQALAAGPSDRAATARLREAARRLSMCAKVPVLRAHHRVIRAAYLAMIGRKEAARRHLDEGEELARRCDAPWVHLEASYLRFHLLRTAGHAQPACREADRAIDLAASIGWHDRARRIRAEAGMTDPGRSASLTTASGGGADLVRLRGQLQALLQLATVSSSVFDPVAHARIVLDETVRITGAERAFLFLVEGGAAHRFAARDSAGNDLGADAGYSRTVVERVRGTQQPLVMTGSDQGQVSGTESVVVYGLRSIIATPLMVHEQLRGVLYLDSRLAKGVFGDEHIGLLTALGNHIGVGLETARAAQIELERVALEKDLAVAAAVQTMFLPQQPVLRTEAFDLAGYYEAAAHAGGDWWWYDRGDDGELRVLLGDVVGHGAGAAMVTAAIASMYRTLTTSSAAGHAQDLGAILETIAAMVRAMPGSNARMTLGALELDATAGRCGWWFAGAPPILYLAPEEKVRAIGARTAPLGDPEVCIRSGHLEMPPGTRFFVFSDGLPELRTTNGRSFGLRKLGRLLEETRDLPVTEALEAMRAAVREARGNAPLDDDLTFALVARRP